MKAHLNPTRTGWMRNVEDPSVTEGLASGNAATNGKVPRIGLALSGGGARGLAHIGVLQVLEEAGIPIAAVAGTSMGAYVGSLYAAGFDSRRLEELAREIKDRRTLLRLLDPIFPPTAGLIHGNKIQRHLERSLGSKTFADLEKPFLVVATDLDRMAPQVIDSGPLGPAVHASAAIPGICAPLHIHGRRFIDGAAAEPLPVSLLRERFDLDAVIAVNVLPTEEDIEHCKGRLAPPDGVKGHWLTRCLRQLLRPINLLADGHVLDTFRRSLMCAQIRLADKESRLADVVVHPYCCEGTWFDFENFERYIHAGRRAAEEKLPQLRQLMSAEPSPPTSESNHENALHHTGVGRCAA